jgi:hypothetical protein
MSHSLCLCLSLSDLDVRMVWNHDVSTLHFHVPFQTSPDLGSLHRPRDLEHTRPPEWDCLLLGLTSSSFSFFSALTDHCLSLSLTPLPSSLRQYRTVWFSWGKLLGLEDYILRLEAGSNEAVRTFGRKSFKNQERPPLNDHTQPASRTSRSFGAKSTDILLPMSRLPSNSSETKTDLREVASTSRHETKSSDLPNDIESAAAHPLDSTFSPLQP